MKICYLAAADSIHSSRWIRYFMERGHEVHWISLAASSEEARALRPLEITSPAPKPLRMARAVLAARRLIHTVRPDVLHAHYAGAYGLVAALTGFHPFVLTAWGSDVLLAGRAPTTAPFIRFALRRADVITVDAEHMVEAVVRLGVARERIRLIYFGTDTAVFQPEARSDDLRRKFGNPIVISLRNLEPVYDVGTLIRSMPAVIREVPSAKFLVIGRGTEEKMLQELAGTLGVSAHVAFLGHLPAGELPRYVASADVYISTALSDAGLAASTAEAMASGLPVIVTESGENRVWVRDGENGFLVPVRDPDALAEKIVHLLKRPEVSARYGQANRQIIVERNNHAQEMGKMEEIYAALRTRGSPI